MEERNTGPELRGPVRTFSEVLVDARQRGSCALGGTRTSIGWPRVTSRVGQIICAVLRGMMARSVDVERSFFFLILQKTVFRMPLKAFVVKKCADGLRCSTILFK